MFTLISHACLFTVLSIPPVAPNSLAPDGLQVGTYKGNATWVIHAPYSDVEMNGRLTITITSIDENGKVKATIKGTNGINLTGQLTGSVDESGAFRFKGTVDLYYGNAKIPVEMKGKAKLAEDKMKGTSTMTFMMGGMEQEHTLKFDLTYQDD